MFTEFGVDHSDHNELKAHWSSRLSRRGMNDTKYYYDDNETEEKNATYVPGILFIIVGSLLWVTFITPLVTVFGKVFRRSPRQK